jgi:hypothetical protein
MDLYTWKKSLIGNFYANAHWEDVQKKVNVEQSMTFIFILIFYATGFFKHIFFRENKFAIIEICKNFLNSSGTCEVWARSSYFCPCWPGRGVRGGLAISAHAGWGGVLEAV